MKKSKRLKIKYIYNKPKTPEEEKRQQQVLDDVYDSIFNDVFRQKSKQKINLE